MRDDGNERSEEKRGFVSAQLQWLSLKSAAESDRGANMKSDNTEAKWRGSGVRSHAAGDTKNTVNSRKIEEVMRARRRAPGPFSALTSIKPDR